MNDRLRSGIISGTYYQKYVAAALPLEGRYSQLQNPLLLKV